MKATRCIALFLFLTACNFFDPYAEKFAQLQVGDSRERVQALMGPPTTISSIEIPFFRLDHLTWNSAANSRRYVVHLFANKVISKVILQ